jgi:hypothetical protein
VDAQGNSVFWTTAVPDSDVSVKLGAGKAELKVVNLAAEDYFNLPNASIPGNEVDATVSFDVVWNGPITRRVNVSDAANGFAGSYVENQATITWSASNSQGFSFVANPGSFATSVPEAGPFAELGREQNGIFFSSNSSDSAVIRSLVQALPVQQPPAATVAAPPVSAALPGSGAATALVIPADQSHAPAITADPGGSAALADNNDPTGELLFR